MKKILSYSLFSAVVALSLASCEQEEAAIFDKSAAERLDEAKDVFTQRIASSQNGWIFEYYGSPETDYDNYVKDVGYLMLAKFNSDNSVVVGMKNMHSSNAYLEDKSLWEVLTDMSAVLSFNSYNKCVHRFSEPENFDGSTSYGGDIGKGMLGDYEFIIVDAPEGGDHIMLKGKKHGAYSRLTRLGDDNSSFESYLDDVSSKQKQLLSSAAPNHLVMNVGEKQYYFLMPNKGGDLGLTKLWPAGTDSTFTMVYNPLLMSRRIAGADTTYVVRFRDAIKGTEESGLQAQEFFYDAKTQTFHGQAEGISIEGQDASSFFFERWSASQARFTLSRSSNMSEKVKELIAAVNAGYSDVKYTFQNAVLYPTAEGAMLSLTYRSNKNQSGSVLYKFSCSVDGEVLKLSYLEPNNSAAQTQLNSIKAIADLCNAISGSYTITSGANKLNLTTVCMTKTDDAAFSFEPTYSK